MEDFRFVNKTDIRFGKNHIDAELHDAVAQFGQNVLLTYGGGSIKRSGLYERVMKALEGVNVWLRRTTSTSFWPLVVDQLSMHQR